MLNSTAILAQVRQGDLPATWSLFHHTSLQHPNLITRLLSRPIATFLLLMPEGLIEYEEKNGQPVRILKTLSYAHISSITIKMWSPDDTDLNRRTHTNTIQIALDLCYNDGKRELWLLDKRYGLPETIAHSIITTYHSILNGLFPKSPHELRRAKIDKLSI